MTLQLDWLLVAIALLLGLAPLGAVVVRASIFSAVVALQLAGVLAALFLLALSQALVTRPWFEDLALTLAVLSFGGAMVFDRFLARWL